MKLFLIILAVFAVSSAGSTTVSSEKRSADEQAIVAESFIDTVKRIIALLKEKGSEFVCSAKLQELLDILGLPDQLDGAVTLAQNWICGDSAVLVKRSSDVDALQGFADWFRELVAKLKAYGKDLVCTTKLQDLLDILGLPDALDGAVKMAQNLICRGSALEERSSDELAIVAESFIDTVKRIIALLKEKGSEFVCSAKLQELLDILGLPDQLDGAVALAQKWICGDSAALVKRSSDVDALQGFADWFKELVAKLKAYGTDLVCTAKLQQLLDILGLPDALDGAVKMAQNLICGTSALEKREIKMTPEMHVQLVGAFKDTVKAIYDRLKTYFRGLVCSSRLQQLLDLLGLPNDLDGAVQMAQEWICSGKVDSTASMVIDPNALEGFFETVKEIFEKLVVLGQSYVCNAGISELVATLGLPDTLVWAVTVAVDSFCN